MIVWQLHRYQDVHVHVMYISPRVVRPGRGASAEEEYLRGARRVLAATHRNLVGESRCQEATSVEVVVV
jgi:hypothetical protein